MDFIGFQAFSADFDIALGFVLENCPYINQRVILKLATPSNKVGSFTTQWTDFKEAEYLIAPGYTVEAAALNVLGQAIGAKQDKYPYSNPVVTVPVRLLGDATKPIEIIKQLLKTAHEKTEHYEASRTWFKWWNKF